MALMLASAAPAEAVDADVGVTVTATPATVGVGGTSTVTAVVTNNGVAVGPSEVVVDPGGATVTSTSGGCTVDYDVTCQVVSLGAGASLAVTVQLRLDDPGQVAVSASVSLLEDFDPNYANDYAETLITVLPPTPSVALAAAKSDVRYGGEVALTATVTVGGAPVDATVTLLRRALAGGAPIEVSNGYTDTAGKTSFTDQPVEQVEYLARVEPTEEIGAATSAPVIVRVGYAVATTVSPVAIPPGGELTVTARVEPAVAGATVVVQERFGSGEWRTIATPRLSAAGRVTVTIGRRSRVGTYSLRVLRPSDDRRTAGSADAATVVTVTGKGRRGAWRPLYGSKAHPTHWGTCTVGFRVNPKNMPAHGMADLRESMRRVTMVSGVRFRYLGRTRLVPYAGDGRAGTNRITVAWAGGRATRGLLAPGIAGVGGTSYDFRGRIRTGFVAMNTAFTKTAPAGFGKGVPHGLVLMHELGHVLGLDHSPDRHAIMNAGAPQPASVWGAADLAGLRAIGKAGGCR